MAPKLLSKLQVSNPQDELPPTFLTSHDTIPIEEERRTWGWTAFLSLWSTLAFNINNFQIGSSLLALGLNYWETFLATLVGHILAATIVVLSSYPGLYYHISFTVATRSAWGYYGSIFVVICRIFLSIAFFGIQSWQGGLMTYACLRAIWPSIDHIHNTIPASEGMTLPQFIGFIVFYVIQLPFLILDPHRLRYLVYTSAAAGFVVQLAMVIWAGASANSFGSVLSGSSTLTGSTLGWVFLFGVSTTMSSLTSGTVSICDYARFAKTPASGQWSQFTGFIPSWLSNVFGILTIAATQVRYGGQLWSVASLLIAIQDNDPTSRTRCAVFFCGFAYILSQISINIVGNSFSGGTDMACLLPRWINIRRGQFITALLGVAINPWRLLTNATIFISVLSSFTIFLQPFLGVLIAHYFVLFKRKLKIEDLYKLGRDETIYWYTYGVNWRAYLAWIVGFVPHVPGFVASLDTKTRISQGATHLYQLTSITSFAFALVTAVSLGYLFPDQHQIDFLTSTTRQEALNLAENYTNSLHVVEGIPYHHESITEDVVGTKAAVKKE